MALRGERRRRRASAGGEGPRLARRLAAEALGTALLLAIVVGSGIQAEALAGGNVAVALLANSVATGAGLVVLITILGPISGAHFNPAVSLVAGARGELDRGAVALYPLAQIVGAVVGVGLAHLMFGRALLEVSPHLRDGPAQWLAEAVATAGLVLTILGGVRHRAEAVPMLVGLYVTAAYWFTASTSFANPAVTLARSLTDSFAGIAPASVPGFLAGQAVGAVVGALLGHLLFDERAPE